MKANVIIVDDEPLMAEELQHTLYELCPNVEVLGIYHDGDTAFQMILAQKPDVVFLDIELPGMDGLHVAQRLSKMDRAPAIVFVTAFMDFAVQAFSVDALDYILKPLEEKNIRRVLEKIKKYISAKNKNTSVGTNEMLSDTCIRKITIDRGDKMDIVDCRDIRLIYGKNRQVYVLTQDDKVNKVRMTLQDFEKRLPYQQFFRCHRNYIVNVDEIKQITTWFKQRYLLVLKGEKKVEIPVGRAYVSNLKHHVEF